MSNLDNLKNAVIKGDKETAVEITAKALAEEVSPEKILQQGLIAGMNEIGEAFGLDWKYVGRLPGK